MPGWLGMVCVTHTQRLTCQAVSEPRCMHDSQCQGLGFIEDIFNIYIGSPQAFGRLSGLTATVLLFSTRSGRSRIRIDGEYKQRWPFFLGSSLLRAFIQKEKPEFESNPPLLFRYWFLKADWGRDFFFNNNTFFNPIVYQPCHCGFLHGSLRISM